MSKVVLTGWPTEDQQTGKYIQSALMQLGYQVINVDPKKVHRVAMEKGQDVTKAITTVMDEQYNDIQPDFVFLSRQSWFEEFALKHKGQVPIAAWNVDVRYHPEEEWAGLHGLMRACSHWFTIAGGNVSWYRKNINPNTHWLSEAIDPSVHRPPNKKEHTEAINTLKDKMFGSCDVSFAGSLDGSHVGPPERLELLRNIHGKYRVKLWGNTPRNYLVNMDHSLMAFFSPINLGHSGWPLVALSQSARDYRVIGAEGFLLTNHCRAYEEWLISGKHFDTYSTIEECLDKIEYYLSHPKERKQIAKEGSKHVHKTHTFKHRMERLIRILSGKGDTADTRYGDWAMINRERAPRQESNIIKLGK
jgi:hypothetical protein